MHWLVIDQEQDRQYPRAGHNTMYKRPLSPLQYDPGPPGGDGQDSDDDDDDAAHDFHNDDPNAGHYGGEDAGDTE